MLLRRARRALPPLLAAVLALSLAVGLAACEGEPEEPPPPAAVTPAATPTPTPEATPAATAAATSSPTATVTPSPTPTARPSPTPTPSATPTATPSPTQTPTSSPTPTATPPPLITAEDLGILEVDTAEALAAAGLTHVRYAAGEEVPWAQGLFLLDAETGGMEGWVRVEDSPDKKNDAAGGHHVDIRLSPDNRFLLLPGTLIYDRHTRRTYQLGSGTQVAMTGPGDLAAWGSGAAGRLVLWSETAQAQVVVDSTMQAVVKLREAAPTLWPDPDGRYLVAHDERELLLYDLGHAATGTLEPAATWPLDWVRWRVKDTDYAWVEPFAGGLAVMSGTAPGSCRIVRYFADGSNSDASTRCWQNPSAAQVLSISPDGRHLAVATFGVSSPGRIYPGETAISIVDATTGAELLRINGVIRSSSSPWLADGSGIVVTTHLGNRVVSLGGRWEAFPGTPAPDDPSLFKSKHGNAIVDRQGEVLASLDFSYEDRPLDEIRRLWVEWAAVGGELRVHASVVGGSGFGDIAVPPLTPVIERPPFDDRLLVEVVVDTCLNVREDYSLDAPVLACLPNGTVAETDDYTSGDWPFGDWLHLRTDDGLEGWASAEYLRWHSEGVRLE